MKYWLPVILLSAFCTATATAQTRVGLRGGLNGCSVIGDDISGSAKSAIGYHVGLFSRVTFLDIRMQPEILVSNRRYTLTQKMGDATTPLLSEKNVSSTYLDIPVFAIIDLSEKWHILAGPQFSLNMSGSQELKNTSKTEDGYSFELFDISAAVGVEYVFANGLDLGIRGAYGLLPVFSKTNALVVGPEKPDIKNITLQFTVGLPITTNAAEDNDERNYNTPY